MKKRVAKIHDDETAAKLYDELRKDNFDFTIRPVADFQELYVNKDQIKSVKDVVKKLGVCIKVTWKF